MVWKAIMTKKIENPVDQLLKKNSDHHWDITSKVPKGHINFSISEPNFPTPAAIRNEAQQIVLSEDLSYSPTPGLDELRELVADYYSYDIGKAGVTITSGASEALYSLMVTLVNPGDEILLPSVGNPNYASVALLTGATVKRYAVNQSEKLIIRAEELIEMITEKTKIILINSPLDPTGQVINQEEFTAISNSCLDRDIKIILDYSYSEIIYDSRNLSFKNINPNVIVFSSLSKVFSLTGWRIGWILSNPEIAKRLNAVRNLISTCAPTVSQRLAIRFFNGIARESFNKIISILSNRKKLMVETLRKEKLSSFVEPVGGYYLFLDLSEYLSDTMDSIEFCKYLSEKQEVAVVPGDLFGEEGKNYIRISFATNESSIQDGVKKIAECVRSL